MFDTESRRLNETHLLYSLLVLPILLCQKKHSFENIIPVQDKSTNYQAHLDTKTGLDWTTILLGKYELITAEVTAMYSFNGLSITSRFANHVIKCNYQLTVDKNCIARLQTPPCLTTTARQEHTNKKKSAHCR